MFAMKASRLSAETRELLDVEEEDVPGKRHRKREKEKKRLVCFVAIKLSEGAVLPVTNKDRKPRSIQYSSYLCNISNTSDSVSSGYPNTEKVVENTTRSGVFLTKFEVFG